ncbi:MAG: WYL domain-containing protein [Flavobacteriales bacterium]|nr:MAG: WYL domain-containing protein [Flavobacteriales bacterium]
MAKNEQILRIKLIEEFLRLRKDKGASYEEIADYLERKFEEKDISEHLKFTKRTFLRDKKAILDISGIEISYSRKNKVYYIDKEELDFYEENILDNVLLVEAYRGIKRTQNIMFFENRKARGLSHLNGLIHAITNRKTVSFTYQKFETREISNRVVEPYALKEFHYRWYLLAREINPKNDTFLIKTFGLDRISDLEIKNKTFKKEQYDIAKAFENSFGIVAPNGVQPQKMVLSFDKHQGNYIKSLPLHHSQKVVKEDENQVVISVFVVPTYDFEREILSYGSRVRILEPTDFRQHMKKEIQKMLEN